VLWHILSRGLDEAVGELLQNGGIAARNGGAATGGMPGCLAKAWGEDIADGLKRTALLAKPSERFASVEQSGILAG